MRKLITERHTEKLCRRWMLMCPIMSDKLKRVAVGALEGRLQKAVYIGIESVRSSPAPSTN